MSKRDRLSETQFSYKTTKEGKLFVYFQGKHVRTYNGTDASDVLAEVSAAPTEREIQFAFARVTGNFKRGNERSAKHKRSLLDPLGE